MEEQKAYCVKCRNKTVMTQVEDVKMKNGRPALKAKCGTCGTGMYKILPGTEKAKLYPDD